MKYEIGHATVSDVLLQHTGSRTEVQSSLILAVKTLLTELKLNSPCLVNQKNAETGGKKCRICQNKLLELLPYPNQKLERIQVQYELDLKKKLGFKGK